MCLNIEHRWHTRKKITLDVQLVQRDLLILNAKTINISMGGMFVQTESAFIDEKTSIDVLLSQRSNNKMKSYRFKAYVVYKNDNGVGLMFYSHEPVVSIMLSDLLFGIRNSKSKATAIYRDTGAVQSSTKINQ